MAEASRREFDWDDANLRHLARHRISRLEFEKAIANRPIIVDFSNESGEERWFAIGATDNVRILFLIYTYRGDRIRPITGWDASKEMRESYFKAKRGEA
jgi:uncharacterized DUF497 family protein